MHWTTLFQASFRQRTTAQNERRGKKVEKNVSVEKIGLGGSYATHCKNDLFNAVFGGCTLPACMCLFKGSTPNTIWKQEIRMIGSERKSESYSCLNASNFILWKEQKKNLYFWWLKKSHQSFAQMSTFKLLFPKDYFLDQWPKLPKSGGHFTTLFPGTSFPSLFFSFFLVL